jgi:hypothetical protein
MRITFGGFRKMKKLLAITAVIILFCTIFLSGCNEQKKPIIASFEVTPNEIELGKTAYISWNVSGATSVTIDNGIGVISLTGNRPITPTETTTYTLTAKSTSTVTATTSIIVHQPIEKPNITMVQSEFYIEITDTENSRVNQFQVSVIAINKNNSENQTSSLRPVINEGDGNPTILGFGDIITFRNLSNFRVGEQWDIQMIYKGDIIGQCIFKNPKPPYDTPLVRMIQSESNITIIGIINGPLEQALCSITAINMTSSENQASIIGSALVDKDNNPTLLGPLDQITFSNLTKFKVGDKWNIQLVYNGDSIGQCIFTNPISIIQIPT